MFAALLNRNQLVASKRLPTAIFAIFFKEGVSLQLLCTLTCCLGGEKKEIFAKIRHKRGQNEAATVGAVKAGMDDEEGRQGGRRVGRGGSRLLKAGRPRGSAVS